MKMEDMDGSSAFEPALPKPTVNVSYQSHFVRRDGGPPLFQSGDNTACSVISYPQRGPLRRDHKPTLSITYSRSKARRTRHARKSQSVIAAKSVLQTMKRMMIPKTMLKTRIRCKVHNVQHGPSEVESAVNATCVSLLHSNYELRDMIAAVSYTKDHLGNDVIFPSAAVLQDAKTNGRARYQFHFDASLSTVWFSVRGPTTTEAVQQAENVCREAAKTVISQMRDCAARPFVP